MFRNTLTRLAALVAAATAAGAVALPAAHADWTYWSAQLDVQYPSAGTISSDVADSGHAVNCGSDGSPGPCTITDLVPGGSTRPTTGWYSYTLHADGGPAGYSWQWTGGCSGISPTCTVVNDQESTSVSGQWIDTQAPVFDVQHVPGVARTPVELYASAHDNSGTVDHYNWVVCHIGGPCLDSLTTTGTIAYLTGVPDGDYVVTPFAVDAAGNGAGGMGTLLTVDGSAPALTVTSPKPHAALDTFQPVVRFSATDGTLQDTRCSVDGGEQVDCADGWRTPYLENGEHTLSVQARDKAGNETTVQRVFTVVDPQVTLIGASHSTYGKPAKITVQVPRNSFGQVEFDDATTGAPLCIRTATANGIVSCTFAGTHFQPGDHDLHVRFTGDATHKIADATFTYTTDRKVASMTAEALSVHYSTNYVLQVTGLPANATGEVQFRAGGEFLCVGTVRNRQARCAVGGQVLDPANYRLEEYYTGDTMYADRTITSRLTVLRGTPSMTATGPSWVRPGTAAHLVAQGLPTFATGTVTFAAKGSVLCTATVKRGTAACDTATTLPQGHYVVTATYSGDTRWLPATAQTIFDVSNAVP